MPKILLRKYKVVQFHLRLHYNIANEREYVIFIRCLILYGVNNNQQVTGDQHSGVIFNLTFFLTSRSKPDYIYYFEPPYICKY